MMTTPHLRPMGVGDLLDTAFRLYRKHFVTFLGIVALLQVPMAIIQTLVQVWGLQLTFTNLTRPGAGSSAPLQAFGALVPYYLVSLLLSMVQAIFIQSLIGGGLARAISRSYLGQPITIFDAYRMGWGRYGALIGATGLVFILTVLIFSVLLGCPIGLLLSQVASTTQGSRQPLAAVGLSFALLGLILLIALPALLFFATRLIFSVQTIVLEDLGPIAGLWRSWNLVGGSFWRVLGVLLLMGLITYIVALIPSFLLSFVLGILSVGNPQQTIINQGVSTLVGQIGMIVALPLLLTVYTLLYYDLRVRKEGYDLVLLMQQADVV